MSAMDDFNNPNLFTENEPGVYTYTDGPLGKTASGQLQTTDDPQRDASAQREAGGEDRRTEATEWGRDDGGHLIGARFGGAADDRNLTAQNSNLNRSDYKRAEESWAAHLENHDKVYVHMEAYTGNDSKRPSNYMGYAIIEHTDENGKTTREIEYYSFDNESRMTKEGIDQEVEDYFRENPDVVEQQRAENTTMEYIWNDEKGDVEKNPYYKPEDETQTQKTEPETAKAAASRYEQDDDDVSYAPTQEQVQQAQAEQSHAEQEGPNVPSIHDYGAWSSEEDDISYAPTQEQVQQAQAEQSHAEQEGPNVPSIHDYGAWSSKEDDISYAPTQEQVQQAQESRDALVQEDDGVTYAPEGPEQGNAGPSAGNENGPDGPDGGDPGGQDRD